MADSAGRELVNLGPHGNLTLGGDVSDGDITLRDGDGQTRIALDGQRHRLRMYDAAGQLAAELGPNGNLALGGEGHDGDVALSDADGQNRINLDAQNHRMLMRDADGNTIVDLGKNGNLTLGGSSMDGDLLCKATDGAQTVHLDGGNGNLTLGGGGHDGDVALLDGGGQNRINFNADDHRMRMRDASGNVVVDLGRNGNLTLGGSSMDGDLICKSTDGVETIHLDGQNGNIRLGGTGHDGDLTLRDSSDNETIHLSGDSGDIILKNADFAEEFDVSHAVAIERGTLMVLGEDGELVPCAAEHDQRVVGVVAGAGAYRPGIVMDRRAGNGHRAPIAMLGKVACQADASRGAIRVGDLLTTSSTPGHAMRVEDGSRAAGTVIGKALSSLESGTGWVNVFVNLQ